MTRILLPGLVALCTACLCGQDAPPPVLETVEPAVTEPEKTRARLLDDRDPARPVSNYRSGYINPGTIEPLTPREKAARALQNSIGPRAFANRLLLTGINQWTDYPEEWPGGMEGFGMRFGSRMGRLWVRNAIQLSADLALKTEPRYDRCDCSGFLARTGHAWRRVFVARKDNGSETIALANLAGAYVTPMVTDQWYPSRINTWQHKLDSGSQFLMWRGGTNMLREFWPQVSRKIPFGRRFYR